MKLFKNETRKLTQAFFHPTFLYLTVLGNAILLIATAIVYQIEKDVNPNMSHYFDSLWWGVSTITTVGYGDVLPQTVLGRMIGIVLMYTGTVLFVCFTGMLLAHLMQEEVEEELTPIQHGLRKEEANQVRMDSRLNEIDERLKRLEQR